MRVFTKKQIAEIQDESKIIEAIEEGFLQYSQGKTTTAMPTQIYFENPPGEAHIKCGYIQLGKYYVIKAISEFYQNPLVGLSSVNGIMLLFDKKTGVLESALVDEGLLTHLGAAAAGAIAAKYLAPSSVKCIGIVGTGIQGRFQLKFLEHVTRCREVIVWGRSEAKLIDYKTDPMLKKFRIASTMDISYLAKNCNLIVTTTPSTIPLLRAHDVERGTHITAVGGNDIGKQELDPGIFKKVERIVADSKEQCFKYGEIFEALNGGFLDKKHVYELGDVIQNPSLHRSNDKQITVAALTGIAIQDLQIAALTFERLIAPKL